jgi:hypothetical protein
MVSDNSTKALKFIDLINESVHTSDDADIGDIEAVNNNFIVVKRGFVNIHYYYIPISKVEGWDGNVVWLNISEEIVKAKYERSIEPDPFKYFIKSYKYYSPDYYPATTYYAIMPLIPSRYVMPKTYSSTVDIERANIIQCDLCQERFSTQDELNHHVNQRHV